MSAHRSTASARSGSTGSRPPILACSLRARYFFAALRVPVVRLLAAVPRLLAAAAVRFAGVAFAAVVFVAVRRRVVPALLIGATAAAASFSRSLSTLRLVFFAL